MKISQTALFNLHLWLQAACFCAALLSRLVFGQTFGIFTYLALGLPIIGFFMLSLSKPGKRRRKAILEYYFVGTMATCFSLLFLVQKLFRSTVASQERFLAERSLPVAQNLFLRAVNPGVWSAIFVIVTTLIILLMVYLLVFLLPRLGSTLFFGILVSGIILNIFFYQAILTYFLFPTMGLFMVYLLWVLTFALTLLTCYDLRSMLKK